MIAITAILNVHREGLLAHPSLLSILNACQVAESVGIATEVLVVADCSDRPTLDYLSGATGVRLIPTDVNDLGLARNIGIAAAAGRYVSFLDGDDLWGPNWLVAAYEASTHETRPTVWHPEANLFFGQTHGANWMMHPDIERAEGDWVTLGLQNLWTSLSFALRDTYLLVPFSRTNLNSGFGYEDWSWNAEVVAHGYLHKPVMGTAHLVRVRDNSLVRRAKSANALMTPSTLLGSRIGWAARAGAAGVAAPVPETYGERAVELSDT